MSSCSQDVPAYSLSDSAWETRSIVEAPMADEYQQKLESLIHTPKELIEGGFIVKCLSDADLANKKKCGACGKSMRPWRRTTKSSKAEEPKKSAASNLIDEPIEDTLLDSENAPSADVEDQQGWYKGSKQNEYDKLDRKKKGSEHKEQEHLVCHFHNGRLISGSWTCCGGRPPFSPACHSATFHTPIDYEEGILEQYWAYHFTPKNTIPPSYRQAVAIDCEMGTSIHNESELIRISLVDYFTSEVLVDSLVLPADPMQHYNTKFSGIAKRDMDQAVRTGHYIAGKDLARETVWQYVGPETIVVGYAVHNDLTSMRWVHGRIVDPFIIERKVVKKLKDAIAAKEKAEKDLIDLEDSEHPNYPFPNPAGPSLSATSLIPPPHHPQQKIETGTPSPFSLSPAPMAPPPPPPPPPKKEKEHISLQLSLKSRVKYRLGRNIQVGKTGHDSVEDAIAARDLVHWIVMSRIQKYGGEGGE